MYIYIHIHIHIKARKGYPVSGTLPYVLNRYSRIPGTQPHEYAYRIPPGEPCIRQEHAPIQGYCMSRP